jgi:hypothetical protein
VEEARVPEEKHRPWASNWLKNKYKKVRKNVGIG